MESGIYRNLASGEDIVVFGGRISVDVSLNNNVKEGCVKLGMLKKKYTPGDSRDEGDKWSDPQVTLHFDNVTSIDILMDSLSYVKDYIQGMSIEGIREKYKGFIDAPAKEEQP